MVHWKVRRTPKVPKPGRDHYPNRRAELKCLWAPPHAGPLCVLPTNGAILCLRHLRGSGWGRIGVWIYTDFPSPRHPS